MWQPKFLTLAAGPSQATISGYRRPLGFQQLTLTGTAGRLTPVIPPNTGAVPGYAVIQCQGSTVTDFAGWRDDGTAPTNTLCMRLFAGQELDYTGDLYSIQFIIGSGSPILNIAYYA